MKTTVQSVWLKKAGALVACSVFVGSPSAALANGGVGNVPTASTIPLGHFQNQPGPAASGHFGTSSGGWGTHGSSASGQNGQASSPGRSSANSRSLPTGSQLSLWHGQPFLSVLPHSATTNAAQSLFSGTNGLGATGPGLQLDLTSTSPSIVLGSSIFQGKQSVTVDLGGQSQVFSAGAHVTAAEYVAVRQVLAGTHQTLVLSSQGAAVGGSFSVNSVSTAKISELVVPTGVTALDYASKSASPGISGDVLNYGTIDGIATRGQGNTISLNAQDIINESGGLITTKLSSSLLASLGGVLSPTNLSLSAVDDISNSGKITTSGSLSLLAATGSITNGAVVSGAAGSTGASAQVPTIQAVHDVNFSTGSGNLTNSGMISSSAGNININTPTSTNDINVSGAGGTFQALSGNINVRDSSYSGGSNISLNGGNYVSSNLNLYSGTGTIEGNVGQVTGKLNTDAGADHLQAATATLLLGNNNAVDPTFVNSLGNIEIVGTNTFGEDVAIIASGNISASSTGQIVDSGHDVTLVAGAKITASASDNNGTVQNNTGTSPYPGSVAGGNSVQIDTTQGSATGGNISLSASTISNVIDTSSTISNAGNVTLVAFGAGTTQGLNGQVNLAATSLINASASGNWAGGNVTVIAPNGMTLGAVNTGGGSAGGQGGAITLTVAPVTTTNPGTTTQITFGSAGAITSGNGFAAGALGSSKAISVAGDLVTSPIGQTGVLAGSGGATAGNITISTAGGVITQNLLAFGGGGSGGDSATANGGIGGNGGNISVSGGEFVAVNGQVNTSGGGGGGAGSNGSTNTGTGGSGGSAGTISISQGSADQGVTALSISGGVFAASGGAGGSSITNYVGGGGASYGGGGGGGSSGTGGTPGHQGTTVGTIGGGGGGAGFFGGGGGDVDGAGGGGGYTGGSAGGSQANAGPGTASAGGNGTAASGGTQPTGGVLTSAQQFGQGTGTVFPYGNGSNIPTTTSGSNNTVTLSTASGLSVGGDIVGSNVIISAPGALTFQGNVFGSTAVTVNDTSGSITQSVSGLSIVTPSLTFNLGSAAGFNIGSSSLALFTNTPSININGTASGTWLSDSTTQATTFSESAVGPTTLSITMTANNASLSVTQLPSTLTTLTLNAGADPSLGGTINLALAQPALSMAGGNVTLTANNLTWAGSATSDLAISTSSTTGSGGTISITINELNGSLGSVAIGSGNGQLNLSATNGGSSTTGGTITLNAPTSNVTVDSTALHVGYTGSGSSNGGTIILNVATLATATTSPIILNASGTGTGNGGTINVTTNNNVGESIGTGTLPTDIELIATNGGGSGTGLQYAGSVTFINLGTGSLTVDPTGLSISNVGATNIKGGTIILTASTIVNPSLVSPLVLNASGAGTGSGGTIMITTNTAGPQSIGASTSSDINLIATNGGVGTNQQTGGTISFINNGTGLLTVDAAGLSIATVAGGATAVNGGSITLTSGTIAASSPVAISADGLGLGKGGTIAVTETFNSGTTVTIGGTSSTSLNFSAQGGVNGGNGGSVTFSTQNTLQLTTDSSGNVLAPAGAAAGTYSAAVEPQSSSGTGGTLILSAFDYATATATTPLIFNVSGQGAGNGGVVKITQLDPTSNLTIGKASGNMQFIATNGATGVSAGEVEVTIGNAGTNASGLTNSGTGTLFIDPTAIGGAVSSLTNANVKGAIILLSAPTIAAAAAVSVKDPLVLNVNGAGTGNGGVLIIEETNAMSNLVVGTKPGQIELLAAGGTGGGSGGELIVTSGGNLTVTPAGLSVKTVIGTGSDNGGFIDLSALNLGTGSSGSNGPIATEGNVLVTGSLTASGAGTGTGGPGTSNGGTIGINSNSTTPLNIGGHSINGVEGSLSVAGVTGGQISIDSTGKGGVVTQTSMSTAAIIEISATNAVGDIDINSTLGGAKTALINISAPNTNIIGGSSGKLITNTSTTAPGTIGLTAGGAISGITTVVDGVSTTKQLQMVTTSLSGTAGGDIDVNDAISSSTTLTVNALTAGDSINLSCGGSITTAGFVGQEMLVPVSGHSLVTSNAMPLAATNAGATITANGTNGNLDITTKEGFTGQGKAENVDATASTDGPTGPASPNAVFISNKVMEHGPDNLNISIASSGSSQGNAMFRSNAVPTASTVMGTYSVQIDGPGQFSLVGNTNIVLGGTIGNSKSIVSIQTTAPGGSITGTALLSGTSVSLISNGGDIGSSGVGAGIQVKATGLTASTLGQGNVYINNQDKSLLTFTGSSAGSFNITTAGGITASSITTSVGDINLSAHGASNVSGLTSIGNIVVNDTAGLLTLSTSTAANSITATSTGGVSILGTTGLTASQGAINITANAASKITSSSQSFGDFTIDDTKGVLTITAATIDSTSGSVGITGAGGATVAGLTSAGNLSINGGTKTVASNVTSTSGEVTIVSPGAATLSDINGSTGISITDSKTTTATTLQTANGPIAVVSNGPGTVSLSGVQTTNGGNINVTTGGTTTLKDFTAVGAVTATTGGATTVGSITTTGSAGDGDISITNATGTLQTSASAQVFAVNGNISLQNNNLKSGSVVIGLGSEIETGTLPSSGTGGNITFTIGTAPTPAASPAQQGTAPSPTLVTPTTSGTGVIDWGTGISAVNNKAGANTVSAINAYVNFNTGGLKPTAIKLDGDTTIIADPPSSTHVVTPAFNEANAVSTGPAPSGSLQPTLQAAGAVASEPLLEPVLPAGQTTSPSGLGTIPSITANIQLVAPMPMASTNGFNGALLQASGPSAPAFALQSAAALQSISDRFSNTDPDARWISETELESGSIPAVLSSEKELGIHSAVSSVLEMVDITAVGEAAGSFCPSSPTSIGVRTASRMQPPPNSCSRPRILTGGLSYERDQGLRHVVLTRGSVLFAPDKTTAVETPFGTIVIAPRSLVLVLATHGGLGVYDFDDTHHAAVKVVTDGKQFTLAPGRHILISQNDHTKFAAANTAQLFAYRGIIQHPVGTTAEGLTQTVFTAEFDLPRAINTVVPLHQLITSTAPQARKIALRVLKTASILAELNTGAEEFHQVLSPCTLAMK